MFFFIFKLVTNYPQSMGKTGRNFLIVNLSGDCQADNRKWSEQIYPIKQKGELVSFPFEKKD
jgi:hypothetical protein